MNQFEGTVWDLNDRLVSPFDDPALEWLTDLNEIAGTRDRDPIEHSRKPLHAGYGRGEASTNPSDDPEDAA
jgi:hypothetical protein